jgi:exodeoxyribonuclease VII large subunit
MLSIVNQFTLFDLEPPVWTVTDLNQHLRSLVEADYRLQDLWVSGEISNLSQPSSGHIYFTLRDTNASIRCVVWRSNAERLRSVPVNGDAVEVHGHISYYETGGQLQFYADRVRPAGIGDLFQKFLELKGRLENEGLFDPALKQPLPAWPLRIGVVTSATAAAFQDVLNVLRRRYPGVEVILSPTLVQGADAPGDIVKALAALHQVSAPDVILVVRGGGSMEDLWAFNTEEVVRAIAASTIPIVTGIGHETDLILSDFAADHRAPTPSAAAELVTPDREELKLDLISRHIQLAQAFEAILSHLRQNLSLLQTTLARLSPRARIADARQSIDMVLQRMHRLLSSELKLRSSSVSGLSQTLRAIGPTAVLERGYALITRKEDGAVVRSVDQIENGDALNVQVQDGTFLANVEK